MPRLVATVFSSSLPTRALLTRYARNKILLLLTRAQHYEPSFYPFNFVYTAIFNVLDVPVTAIPVGLSRDGMPLGVQVVAAKGNDGLCLRVAQELEREFGGWVEPSYK